MSTRKPRRIHPASRLPLPEFLLPGLLLAGTLLPGAMSAQEAAPAAPLPQQAAIPEVFPQPLRVVELITGECWLANVLGADERRIELKLTSGVRAKLDRRAVYRISSPARLVDVWNSSAAADADATTLPELVEPLTGGRLQVGPAQTGNTSAAPTRLVLAFGSGAVPGSRFSLQETSAGDWDIQLPAEWTCNDRQALRPEPQQPLVLTWTPTEWTIRIGNRLRMQGTKPAAALSGWTSGGNAAPNAQPFAATARILLQRQRDEEPALVSHEVHQDTVWLVDGSELFGRLLSIQQTGLSWSSAGSAVELHLPWSDIVGIQFAAPPPAFIGEPVSGDIATLSRPETGGNFPLPRTSWRVAISTPAATHKAWAEHPFLTGRFPVPSESQIVREFTGRSQWLLPGMVHLGDEIHADFKSPLPRSAPLSGSWSWAEVPPGSVLISADVAGMEPAGPGTPPTQPFLDELRAGRLRTELWINHQWAGCWNEQLSWKPGSRHPATIRLPVDAALLKDGENLWEIRQTASANGKGFDDLEIGRMTLEVHSD